MLVLKITLCLFFVLQIAVMRAAPPDTYENCLVISQELDYRMWWTIDNDRAHIKFGVSRNVLEQLAILLIFCKKRQALSSGFVCAGLYPIDSREVIILDSFLNKKNDVVYAL